MSELCRTPHGAGMSSIGKNLLPKRHSLLKEGEQSDLVFIHEGEQVALSSGKNPLNGSTMWWWSNNTGMFTGHPSVVHTMVKNIRSKTEVLLDTFKVK